MKPAYVTRIGRNAILILITFSLLSCYHYRVLNTNNDPSTEYRKQVLKSYAWGLVNKPKDFRVPNCSTSNALDEIVYTKNFGRSVVTMLTLGFFSSVEVQWKCHKPCPRVDSL